MKAFLRTLILPMCIFSISLFVGCANSAPTTEAPSTIQITLTPTPKPNPTETPIPTITPAPSATPTLTPIPTQDPSIISTENVSEITELAQLGRGEIHNVEWAPDGSFIAVSSATGIYIFEGQTMSELAHLDVDSGAWTIAISPDGKTLAAPISEGRVNLWDVDSGQLLSTLNGNASSLFSLVFSPDGKVLAAASGTEEIIQLWDVETGELEKTLPGITDDSIVGGIPRFNNLAFSPNRRILAADRADTRVLLWDVHTGYPLHTLTWLENMDQEGWGSISTIAFSFDGNLLASSSEGTKIRIWDVETGQIRHTLEREAPYLSYEPEYLVFSRDGNTLLDGSGEFGKDKGLIRHWDLNSEQLQDAIEVIGEVKALSPDGEKFISEKDGDLLLGNTRTGEILHSVQGFTEQVRSIAFSPDGTTLLSGGWGGTARLWEIDTGQILHTADADTRWIFSVAFSQNGDIYVTGEGDPHYAVRIWDSQSGELLRTLTGHTELIDDIDISPIDKFVASTSDNSIRLWHISNGKQKILDRKGAGVIAFSPDGNLLVAGGTYQSGLRIYDTSTNNLIKTFDWNEKIHFSIAFSPDGELMALGGDEFGSGKQLGTVRLADIESGQILHTLVENIKRPVDIVFSPDGQLLAIATGNTIQIWHVTTHEQLATIETTKPTSLAFSPDGKILASGSENGIVYLWGIQNQ